MDEDAVKSVASEALVSGTDSNAGDTNCVDSEHIDVGHDDAMHIETAGSAVRKRRACIAERLLRYEPELTSVVEWSDLDALPDWCILSDSDLRVLVTQCGVVAYSPLMLNIIDGRVLRDYLVLAGGSNYAAAEVEAFDNLPIPDPDTLSTCIDIVGASILISSVGNSLCKPALIASLPIPPLMEFVPSKERAVAVIKIVIQRKSIKQKYGHGEILQSQKSEDSVVAA